MNKIRELQSKRQKALDAAKAINATAEAAGLELTAEQKAEIDGHLAAVASLDDDIKRQKALDDAAKSADGEHITGGEDRRTADPKRGFKSFGEFATAVKKACAPGGAMDERLLIGAAPTTYGSEGSMADGGFTVPTEFSREVFQHSLEEDSLLALTDNYELQGNALTFPKDETTPWGTDGLRAYWEDEAAQATQTKPKGQVETLRLGKLTALVPVTDELMADSGALERYIGRKTAESIRWKTNAAIYEGDGIGKPLGFFGHACQVSVAKESGQTADTIVAGNIAKMFGRMLNPQNAVWLVNHDAFNQLPLMTIGDQPVWTPPNAGLKEAPNGLLLGRPVILTQLCETLGDKGDIIFANLKYYRSITKAGGIQTATSMHLFFDYNMTAFRAVFRVSGKPILSAAVTPNNGAASLSPFVTVDART